MTTKIKPSNYTGDYTVTKLSTQSGDYELQMLGATNGLWRTIQKYETKDIALRELPNGLGWRIIGPDIPDGISTNFLRK